MTLNLDFVFQASGEGEQECLEKVDVMNRARWRVGVREIAVEWGKSGHPRLRGETRIKIGLILID